MGEKPVCWIQYCWSWLRQLRSLSYGFVGILRSSRLILLYSDHLEGRQTVENHLVHKGASSYRHTHVMMSSISILVIFFAVFIFAEAGLSVKIAKICTQRKFPAIRYSAILGDILRNSPYILCGNILSNSLYIFISWQHSQLFLILFWVHCLSWTLMLHSWI